MEATLTVDGIEVRAALPEAFQRVLTPEALRFAGALAREFEERRQSLLERRQSVQQAIDNGHLQSGFADHV